jgi:outer membrane receptor protein involved in Fe transport
VIDLKISSYCTICIFILTVWAFPLVAQPNNQINGRVQNQEGSPLLGVTIRLEPTSRITQTDQLGDFEFKNVPSGTYQLDIRYLGYTLIKKELSIPVSTDSLLVITLEASPETLETVHIRTTSENELVRQQVIKALVVDTRQAAEQPTTLSELMNRTTGMRVRQSGGLGNPVDVSINGFQGNSVQYFRDGIPLDYLGSGYGLQAVPVNLLERVEVYKGVIPIRLGGDALGGAVNLVSRKQDRSNLHASYEVGSFHTHIAQFSFYHTKPEAKWFIGMEGFYNNAQNDYQANVQVVNAQANLEDVRVRLFHNGYEQGFGEAYVGIKNVKWADELRFSIAGFGIDRDSQHPALMTNPYGAVKVQQSGWIPSLRYRKSFLNESIKMDQFLTYSQIERGRIDTLHGTYDWFGVFTPSTSMGESPRRSNSSIDFNTAISRTHLSAQIAEHQLLEANWTMHLSNRIGEDPYGLRFQGTDIDVLSRRATYNKSVGGISWQSQWLNDRLTNTASLKYFYYHSKGIDGFLANETQWDDYKSQHQHHWGASNAIKYQINPFQFVRGSVELTNRLPRENELFGDSDTRAPNFDLQPERSFNAQMSYTLQKPQWQIELGGFYRLTKGMILLIPVQPPFAQYQNLDSVRGFGFEVEAKVHLNDQIQVFANSTWQDNRMMDIQSPLHQWMEGTRLRNTPYFFANAGLMGNFKDLLKQGDRLQPYAHWNYIREFYLNHIPREKEPGGFLGLFGTSGVPITNIVPDQHLVSLGATYFATGRQWALSGEIKNLLDAPLFDYYKIQRPGRSFHLKMTYTLNP